MGCWHSPRTFSRTGTKPNPHIARKTYFLIVFAQLSDTHLDGSQRRFDRAAAVMAYLNGLSRPLDAVLVTGDIADHGLPTEYEQARTILASSPHPVFTCPGNHDARDAYRKVLLGGGTRDDCQKASSHHRPIGRHRIAAIDPAGLARRCARGGGAAYRSRLPRQQCREGSRPSRCLDESRQHHGIGCRIPSARFRKVLAPGASGHAMRGDSPGLADTNS